MQLIPSGVQRLLVKLPASVNTAALFHAGSASGALFRSQAIMADDAGTFVGGGLGHNNDQSRWHSVVPMPAARLLNPWDAAHQLVQRVSADSGRAAFSEPDVLQQMSISQPVDAAAMLSGAICSEAGFDPDWDSAPPPFGWHLSDEFSGLKKARDRVGDRVSASGKRVRIGHLDTGYDPNHVSKPMRLHAEMAWNFVDNNNSAVAPSTAGGLFPDPSHGTGTLGLLAGNRIAALGGDFLGGAPYADIVPVRIGNTWLQLGASALSAGIEHAVGWSCDIISISAGGVPAQSWADSVNRAYDQGCCIFAASGDSKGGLPTHLTIYPARFGRVVSVCGVTRSGTPYYRDDFFGNLTKTEGSWGPDSAMKSAISAYSPNVPWAKQGCSTMFDRDGGGTSAATPQAAAAGALWLQLHMDELSASEPWQRVEAIRYALFSGASTDGSPQTFSRLGRGRLRADAALDVSFDPSKLTKAPLDTIDFALLKELFGIPTAVTATGIVHDDSDLNSNRLHMLEVEAVQMVMSSPQLAQIVGDADIATDTLPAATAKQLVTAMRSHPGASVILRTFLDTAAAKM